MKKWLWAIATGVWFLWVGYCVFFCVHKLGHMETLVGYCLGLATLIIYALSLTRQLAGMTFHASLFICVIVATLFISLGVTPLHSVVTSSSADDAPMMTPCSHSLNMSRWSETEEYPICGRTWGAPSARMSVLELGALSAYAYQSLNEARSAEIVDHTFSNRRAQYVKRAGYELTGEELPISTQLLVVRFPPEPPATKGTVVVSFRGTANADDVLLDASMYTIIHLAQVANSVIVPLLSILPSPYIHYFLRLIRPNLQDRIFHNYTQVTRKILNMTEFENDSFVFTGHSLGGLVAQTLGTKMHSRRIQTLVFSAPGSGWMSTSFGERADSESMNKYTVVIPHHDPVPMVDVHMGARQPIECRSSDGGKMDGFHLMSLFIAPACHSIQRTMCELWRTCGDQQYVLSRCVDKKEFFAVDPRFVGRQYSVPDWATVEM
jgi:hypothetical protein